jgi:hypothetical protein
MLAGQGSSSREFLGNASGNFILAGAQGRFGSRRLGLWGSDLIANLVTTMLSARWRREDVTELNCVVARIDVDNGVARSNGMVLDTSRVTIGASGTLDLRTEALTVMFAPQPKRANLISFSNPALVTGTLSAPVVESTVLPRRRLAILGSGVVAGLLNPAYMVFAFSQLGTGTSNPCQATIEAAEIAKQKHFGNSLL